MNGPTANTRLERDSMGEMSTPAEAYWGAQTQRAVENFPISGIRFPRPFIRALGLVKLAAARANAALGLLPGETAAAVEAAAREVMDGRLDGHFPLDIFQTGSGTSTNMNANEVIARRASEIAPGAGSIHPNDHVNMGQSSNDVIPTCMHVAALEQITGRLVPVLERLAASLGQKAGEFSRVIKIGRTHLQDATPVLLGQEFGGYGRMVRGCVTRIIGCYPRLRELAIGGTAVGTGINTHPEFASTAIATINELTRLDFAEAADHFEAQGGKDAIVETSAMLKCCAISLTKIANDIRWLGSGPRCGIGEIVLPPVQPGSSIMPGKVNPVMAEALLQVCAQVTGNDAAVSIAGAAGTLELNVMMPVMAHNLLQSIDILANAVALFDERCIRGLKADAVRCGGSIEKSLALVTALAPAIGYDKAAAIAKQAHETDRTIRDVVLEKRLLPADELERLLDPWKMT